MLLLYARSVIERTTRSMPLYYSTPECCALIVSACIIHEARLIKKNGDRDRTPEAGAHDDYVLQHAFWEFGAAWTAHVPFLYSEACASADFTGKCCEIREIAYFLRP